MKKAFYIIASAVAFISCSKNKQEVQTEEKVAAFKPAAGLFENEAAKGKALLLCDNLLVYDRSGKVTGSANALYGLIFDIDSISSKRVDIAKTGDDCNEFNFVKIGNRRINGWLYSKDVYGYGNNEKDTVFTSGGITFKVYTAKNYSVGASDENGLRECVDITPVVMHNSKFGVEAFVPLKDKTKKFGNGFLVLDSTIGWYDKIKATEFTKGKLRLIIEREYQEGSADFTILISLSNKGYMAEVIDIAEHPAE